MLSPIQMKPKSSGGGGMFGKILGGVVGAGAAVATGGAALPAIGAGMAIGGAAGNMVNPAKSEGGQGVALSQVAQQDPQVKFQELRDAQKQLLQDTTFTPEEKNQLHGVLEQGKLYYKPMFGGK